MSNENFEAERAALAEFCASLGLDITRIPRDPLPYVSGTVLHYETFTQPLDGVHGGGFARTWHRRDLAPAELERWPG